MRHMVIRWLVVALPCVAAAGPPEVVEATASKQGDTWRFDVTIAHADTGWDHYADGWFVLAPDGTELGYRELLHPHVNEQPFTRSLSGVVIPDGTREIFVKAHCSVDGWSSDLVRVDLSR